MRRKYSKIPTYWQRSLAKKIFGNDNPITLASLEKIDPEVDESTLSIKVKSKMDVISYIEQLKKKSNAPTNNVGI